MNSEQDDLRELWLQENAGAVSPTKAPLPDAAAGRSETARLRRRVRLDGWMKLLVLLVLGAALPLLAGRMNAAAWAAVGFSLLGAVLGAAQLAWSSGWSGQNTPLPLAQGLASDLDSWRRRRPALALLLGATPALAFQIYVLAYLALNPGSSGKLVNLIFLVAGGPLLWLLASWRQWARLDAWLLQIESALAAFDEQAAARCKRARKRAGRRTTLIAALFLLLLLAGVVLYWLSR